MLQVAQATAVLDPLRNTLSGDVHDAGYGFGFEGYEENGVNREPTSFFEDIMYEIRASSPVYDRHSTAVLIRSDVYNSMSSFEGVDSEFAASIAAEMTRQGNQTVTPPSVSPPDLPRYHDRMDIDHGI